MLTNFLDILDQYIIGDLDGDTSSDIVDESETWDVDDDEIIDESEPLYDYDEDDEDLFDESETLDEDEEDEGDVVIKSWELKYEAAKRVLDWARDEVPVDTGSLRDSGKIERTANGYKVIFGTGKNRKTGKPIDYATIVHEDEDAFHEIGNAKYLEMAAYFVSVDDEKFEKLHFNLEYNVPIGDNEGCMVANIY